MISSLHVFTHVSFHNGKALKMNISDRVCSYINESPSSVQFFFIWHKVFQFSVAQTQNWHRHCYGNGLISFFLSIVPSCHQSHHHITISFTANCQHHHEDSSPLPCSLPASCTRAIVRASPGCTFLRIPTYSCRIPFGAVSAEGTPTPFLLWKNAKKRPDRQWRNPPKLVPFLKERAFASFHYVSAYLSNKVLR